MARKTKRPELTGTPAQWISRALQIDDIDSAQYWQFVSALQARGDRATLDQMLELSRGDGAARRLALLVLGRFGEPKRTYQTEIVARLLKMWREKAGDADADLVAALGHYSTDSDVRQVLLGLVEHPDFWVRWYLTHAFGADGAPASVAALIQLSRDEDAAVRDWATFALGNLTDAYTPAVRAALLARLDDADARTRLEAIHGLVEHGEPKVLAAIVRALEPDESGQTLWDKAEDAPDYRVLPALYAMRDAALEAADAAELRAAIAGCEALLALRFP